MLLQSREFFSWKLRLILALTPLANILFKDYHPICRISELSYSSYPWTNLSRQRLSLVEYKKKIIKCLITDLVGFPNEILHETNSWIANYAREHWEMNAIGYIPSNNVENKAKQIRQIFTQNWIRKWMRTCSISLTPVSDLTSGFIAILSIDLWSSPVYP